MAPTGSFNGENEGNDANRTDVLSCSGRRTRTAVIIPFPRQNAAACAWESSESSSSWLSDHHFESLGDLTRAVVLRLQSDLPRLSVFASREEE